MSGEDTSPAKAKEDESYYNTRCIYSIWREGSGGKAIPPRMVREIQAGEGDTGW